MSEQNNDVFIRLKALGIETLDQLNQKIKETKKEVGGMVLGSQDHAAGLERLKSLREAHSEVGKAGQTANSAMMSSYFRLGEQIREVEHTAMGLVATFTAVMAGFEGAEKAAKLDLLSSSLETMAKKSGADFSAMMSEIDKKTNGVLSQAEKLSGIMRLNLTGVGFGQIPEIMEFAEKRSKLVGKSFEETLNAIEMAAMGGKKALRSLLIPIDVDRAVEEYAKKIGVLKEELSEAGKKHAIFNVMLEEGKRQQLDVNEEAGHQVDTFEKLKSSVSDMGTELGRVIGLFAPLLDDVTTVARLFSKSISEIRALISGDLKQARQDAKDILDISGWGKNNKGDVTSTNAWERFKGKFWRDQGYKGDPLEISLGGSDSNRSLYDPNDVNEAKRQERIKKKFLEDRDSEQWTGSGRGIGSTFFSGSDVPEYSGGAFGNMFRNTNSAENAVNLSNATTGELRKKYMEDMKRQREQEKRAHEEAVRGWKEENQGAMAAINSIKAGFASMIDSQLIVTRQAVNMLDGMWIAMENSFITAVGNMAAAWMEAGFIKLLGGVASGGGTTVVEEITGFFAKQSSSPGASSQAGALMNERRSSSNDQQMITALNKTYALLSDSISNADGAVLLLEKAKTKRSGRVR